MMFEPQGAPRRRRQSADRGAWREISPVMGTSADGVVFGRLEAQVEPDGVGLEAELNRAHDEARRLAYLLAIAGHDLRQPLQVVLLALDRVATQDARTGSPDWLAIARAEVRNLAASLADLARSARLSEPEPVRTRLGALLRAATNEWRHHAAVKGLRLAVVDSNLSVIADPKLLLTAVRNLIGNAVGHTRAGGVVVGVRRQAGGCRIDIVDTGPGLDVDGVAALFEPHRRGASDMEGLGLGLAIVRDSAERLGVQIGLASAPGRGARFSLTLAASRQGRHAPRP
ncbi:sensor histidine kinase [Phenylobacterium koreense]|uniref:histidine kinase n=1 Tax=Phenylobacterium koreense TaxID=266125 RepID=A0ABV2ENB0_9CAUL